jgi:5-methyltetrahydropteroyltriglutamate--homocysteine methyltransferase
MTDRVSIPSEPIGSLPRTAQLLEALAAWPGGGPRPHELEALGEQMVLEAIRAQEDLGATLVTDGEQTKPSFATYPLHGLTNLADDGAVIPFADGHIRQLPRLTAGPFRYACYASDYLAVARRLARVGVKQAVISASALSLLYPAGGVVGYPQEQFVADLIHEAETDIRRCLEGGAEVVQIDFTEGRLSLKLDPSGGLLRQMIDLNNQVLARFSPSERVRIGVHTCPGGDRDSTHSADIDYAQLLPELFRLQVGRFYLQLASEPDRGRVLELVRQHLGPERKVFVGVTDPIDPRVETPEQVRDRVLEASRYIPLDQLGTTDDCGFAPFCDDLSTSRATALAKMAARLQGTRLAAAELAASPAHDT